MSQFLRLLNETDKAQALTSACARVRHGEADPRHFELTPESFNTVPGKPFAYWVSEVVNRIFSKCKPVEGNGIAVFSGVSTKDDVRFIRLWWESNEHASCWEPHVRGGAKSSFYYDPVTVLNWNPDGRELEAERVTEKTYKQAIIPSREVYFRPGLTWPLRTTSRLSVRALPSRCILGTKGPAILVEDDAPDRLLALLAITNSSSFFSLVELQLAAADAAARSYEVGVMRKTPIPEIDSPACCRLSSLARIGWSLKRTLDSVEETSHAFLLPAALRARCGDYDRPAIEAELVRIQTEIDEMAFDLYGFSDADRTAVTQPLAAEGGDSAQDEDEDEEEAADVPADTQSGLLAWAAGVAFGRFDWRLATGERQAPPEPEPFDPLPDESPGMLADGFDSFHAHPGLLVDDPGHPHDLAHLVEEVLAQVAALTPDDVRRWLQRDFFPFHLQRYSKSRRKAPIYWPLATTSGSYTLWVYYPSLSSQTLYTAINDFVEPKLKQVGEDVAALRVKGGARTRDDEKQFEALQSLEAELLELRDKLQEIAPGYRPQQDDGVQITAAPLWPLFRHKPWQKVLKDTWTKLEKGEYDWAHLAMAYWPDRVREKCKTDKSLAIAHGLEELYIEPEAAPKKTRGLKKADI